MGLSATQTVANINTLTGQVYQLETPANAINILSGPLFLIGQGPFPQIIVGFTQVIGTITNDIQATAGTQPYTTKTDEDSILQAFTLSTQVIQEMLNILIGKSGILNDLPLVGPPVAQVLRSFEAVVDTYAFNLIELCPDVTDAFTTQKNALDVTMGQAITAYTPAV